MNDSPAVAHHSIDARPSWRDNAACRGMPVEMFFPVRGDNETMHEAKAVCAGCPVAHDCIADGFFEHWGIWGGRSEKQRRRLRRLRRLGRDPTFNDEPDAVGATLPTPRPLPAPAPAPRPLPAPAPAPKTWASCPCGTLLPPGRPKWCSASCFDENVRLKRSPRELIPSLDAMTKAEIEQNRTDDGATANANTNADAPQGPSCACGKPLPPGRTVFCSDDCSKAHDRERARNQRTTGPRAKPKRTNGAIPSGAKLKGVGSLLAEVLAVNGVAEVELEVAGTRLVVRPRPALR